MISKTGFYVVRAVVALAEFPKGEWVGTSVLAEKIDAPVNYLSKLLHLLARERIVVSQKGIHGGVRLARSPQRITLYEVLNPFEDFDTWRQCLLGNESCPHAKPCRLYAQWGPIREQVLQFFQQTTVADLASQPKIWENLPG